MENSQFRPILFSTPMVQAILEGRKTQTRRIVKKKYSNTDLVWHEMHSGKTKILVELQNDTPAPRNNGNGTTTHTLKAYKEVECPYNVGDVLWVRETVKVGAWNEEEMKAAFDYKASPELKKTPWCYFQDEEKFNKIQMKCLDKLDKLGIFPEADETGENYYFNWEPGKSPFKWTPSIFMPKEACRIFLKIKSIKVERLQDISEEDAKAEGVLFDNQFKKYTCYFCETKWHKGSPSCNDGFFNEAIASFYSLWVSINGDESFKANPFVFVYEFEQIEKPLDFIV